MSEMQSKNWCSQAAARYGNGKSNRCSLLYLRVLEAGISEIMMADRILLVGHPHSVRQREPQLYRRRLAIGLDGWAGIMVKSVNYLYN
jgi:hypothetical protein